MDCQDVSEDHRSVLEAASVDLEDHRLAWEAAQEAWGDHLLVWAAQECVACIVKQPIVQNFDA